jgi:hypothetical protein
VNNGLLIKAVKETLGLQQPLRRVELDESALGEDGDPVAAHYGVQPMRDGQNRGRLEAVP